MEQTTRMRIICTGATRWQQALESVDIRKEASLALTH